MKSREVELDFAKDGGGSEGESSITDSKTRSVKRGVFLTALVKSIIRVIISPLYK